MTAQEIIEFYLKFENYPKFKLWVAEQQEIDPNYIESTNENYPPELIQEFWRENPLTEQQVQEVINIVEAKNNEEMDEFFLWGGNNLDWAFKGHPTYKKYLENKAKKREQEEQDQELLIQQIMNHLTRKNGQDWVEEFQIQYLETMGAGDEKKVAYEPLEVTIRSLVEQGVVSSVAEIENRRIPKFYIESHN